MVIKTYMFGDRSITKLNENKQQMIKILIVESDRKRARKHH